MITDLLQQNCDYRRSVLGSHRLIRVKRSGVIYLITENALGSYSLWKPLSVKITCTVGRSPIRMKRVEDVKGVALKYK